MANKLAQKPEAVHILSPDELRALQMVLLEMMLEIDRICKKCDISYTLIAGTLLGAVRHGGFIPWDDDLDIAMRRDEYTRFREACATELDLGKYFFQDNTTDPHYRWGYGRLRRKDSEFIREGQQHMKMKTGIFLDIFPVDNVPDSRFLEPLHCLSCFVLRKLLYSETGMVSAKSGPLRLLYRLLYMIPARFALRSLENLAEHMNRRATRVVRCYTFPVPEGKRPGYLREWYEELTELEFEGHMLRVPKNYEEYLTYKFGSDYMILPPPEKRHWHPAVAFKLPQGSDGI